LRKAERLVAGRQEPKRKTIFGRAYRTFQRRARAAWRAGFGRYVSLVTIPWRALTRSAEWGYGGVARVAGCVAGVCGSWAGRTLGILRATTLASCGIWFCISIMLKICIEANLARIQRREPDFQSVIQPIIGPFVGSTESTITIDPAKLSLVEFAKLMAVARAPGVYRALYPVAQVIAVACAVLTCVYGFSPLSQSVGQIIAGVLLAVAAYLIWDIGRIFLTFVLMFLFLPLILVAGVLGLAWAVAVSAFFLAILIALLLVMTAFAVAVLAVLAAVLTGVALTATLLFVPIVVGSIGFGAYLLGLVLLQCAALLAITLLRPGQYIWVVWRGIAYVCPSGGCSKWYRRFSVPAHICQTCGSAYSKLWPSFYGVLHHICEGKGGRCQRPLPTLDLLGRNQLNRVCVGCGEHFISPSAGKLPPVLVGIAGGTSAGKTTTMLMAIAQLTGRVPNAQTEAVAEIDTPDQRAIFEREWKRLSQGMTVAPTTGSVPDAFILRLDHGRQKSLLYLYDAPGEQYSRIDRFSRHQYLQHVKGLMLLVDPAGLPRFVAEAGRPAPEVQASATPLDDVARSTVAAVEKMVERGTSKRLPVPLAVVIAKADLDAVKRRVGDPAVRPPDGAACRDALLTWGAGPALQNLESNFAQLRYFACSALGRIAKAGENRPFEACGVLGPLLWVLETESATGVAGKAGERKRT